jgi:hypothetical protein
MPGPPAGHVARGVLGRVADARGLELRYASLGLGARPGISLLGLRLSAAALSGRPGLRAEHGLGLFVFRGGWFGNGGSAPGFQRLARFHPARQVGYVILSNVNAILGGGANYESARSDVYDVQNALVSILDPTYVVRSRAGEIYRWRPAVVLDRSRTLGSPEKGAAS